MARLTRPTRSEGDGGILLHARADAGTDEEARVQQPRAHGGRRRIGEKLGGTFGAYELKQAREGR